VGATKTKTKKKKLNWEKKLERAVINTLQLATRKNLIQMSSDVIITMVTVIINY
jgi:hypothetical protein